MIKTGLKWLIGLILLAGITWICLLFWSVSTIDRLPIGKQNNLLRVLSMNVSTGNILDDSLQNSIIASDPDIITIIEWTGDNINLSKFTAAGYKVAINHPRKKVHGLCVLSKLEGQSAIIESPIKTPCALPLGMFRFEWSGNDITLFAIHAPPPVPSCKGTTSEYLVAVSDWISNGRLNRNIGCGKANDLSIMAGDFNSICIDKGIRALKGKGLTEANTSNPFAEQTWKPFKGFPHIAKIDYILFTTSFSATNAIRFNINNSDHLGLQTDLIKN